MLYLSMELSEKSWGLLFSDGQQHGAHSAKVGDVDVSGKRAMRIRIELDSVLRLLLPQLELVIDPETKRTLEYSGVTNIKDPATRKSYQARINFSYK